MSRFTVFTFVFLVSVAGNAFGDLRKPVVFVPFDASVDSIFEALKAGNVKNVVQAVSLFDPQFFKAGNFRLFFQSQSIQPGSLEFPRVVLAGKDSKMFVGFNHKLGEQRALEFVEFKEADKKWEFREIGFVNGKPAISSRNPKMCLQCHGEPNAKPNTLRFEAARLERSLPVPSFIRIQPLVREAFWNSFVAKVKGDPVYSRLELPLSNGIMR